MSTAKTVARLRSYSPGGLVRRFIQIRALLRHGHTHEYAIRTSDSCTSATQLHEVSLLPMFAVLYESEIHYIKKIKHYMQNTKSK